MCGILKSAENDENVKLRGWVLAFGDGGSGGDGQWKEHTNEQPPTGKFIPPWMFTAQGLLCVALRFSVNILGMCVCGSVRSWGGVLCGVIEMQWKKRLFVCVPRPRWMCSRSGCLSALGPDQCGSNLRQYDVIDYLIFWGPAHRPSLSAIDAHMYTHFTQTKQLAGMKWNKSGLICWTLWPGGWDKHSCSLIPWSFFFCLCTRTNVMRDCDVCFPKSLVNSSSWGNGSVWVAGGGCSMSRAARTRRMTGCLQHFPCLKC